MTDTSDDIPTVPASESDPEEISSGITDFDPVPVNARFDGWTAEKQIDFIEALAESGCVSRAAKAVGMSASTAYRLRRRTDAQAFRLAWEAALNHAVDRLSHAALSRAIHGVPRPVFYKGEQVGEWRHFDERLTVFLMRLRDPVRYGKWRDAREMEQHRDGPALILGRWINRLTDWLFDPESYDPGDAEERIIGYEDADSQVEGGQNEGNLRG